jgi:class 3 adenylate cyclase/tetratricopeptide (TPR) repeat protein
VWISAIRRLKFYIGDKELSDISRWLSDLGLEKYVSAFADAEIDFETLPELAEEDLKELGLPLGPRRKVWGAIKRLIAAPAVAGESPDTTAPSETATSEPAAASDAERRHLTVMFVDLVGSTEMATKIDPEDMRGVITAYQNTIAGIVTRFEGFVAKFMGDGVLCYFGWPRANEDDAERAVRAGLAMIAAIGETSGPDGLPLSTRVGIATGLVIVGDIIGSGATQEAAVVGETPNLAARLQGLAQPNQLVLPKETLHLLGDVFEVKPMGGHKLKGIAQPVEAFAVIGETTRESRFAARQSGLLTPIVGREQELGLLRDYWVKAASGSGQMIVVTGEAGIGKSRITQAAIDEIAQQDHARITYQCSPYHSKSAFHPIIQQLTFVTGINPIDEIDTRLDKLEALDGVDQDNAPLLANLLGLDGSARYGTLALTPAQIRSRTIEFLVRILIKRAETKPLLVVFEDLHWVDPTTLEALDLTLDAIADEKILILGTARPTFEHGFGGHPLVTRFALNRLGREQILSIINKLTDGKTLPDEVLQIISDRTDGVPLFVEELTKTILESGVLKVDGDRLVLRGPLNALAIPSTLHDSLMARLDRLQPIKEVAQTAACIGREFEHNLLAKISPLSDADLDAALDGLIKAELVYRRGLAPDATYLFKHALVRDAAYESLLKERRKGIHTVILTVLENEPDIAPEILAVHAEAADLTDRAVDLWEAASKAAIARPAYDEGLAHLRRAIAILVPRVDMNLADALGRSLDLQVQLGVASMARMGWGADETKIAFEDALILADRIGETPLRFSILYGLMTGRYLRAESAEAVRHGEAFVQLAETAPVTAPAVVANRSYGITLMLVGRFIEAQKHLDRAFDLFDPEQHMGLEIQYGQDLGVASNCFLASNLTQLGESQRAQKHLRDAEHYADASSHISSICYMHMVGMFISLQNRDEVELERHLGVTASLATEHSLVWFDDLSSIIEALLRAGKGDATAIADYLIADEIIVKTKSIMLIGWLRTEAGRRALELGNLEQARHLASMAEQMMDDTGEAFALADLHCLKAALSVAKGDMNAAEHDLSNAIETTIEQGAKLPQLRASIDLARLYQEQSRTTEAIALLQPIYDSIADGDCPEDKAIAQALLNELAD